MARKQDAKRERGWPIDDEPQMLVCAEGLHDENRPAIERVFELRFRH
jgi:hypothetical protein